MACTNPAHVCVIRMHCFASGAAMYSSTDRVRARWPPRCTAALEAFFQLERQAEALDYDGQRRMFTFQ
jgi:hypothetical protein